VKLELEPVSARMRAPVVSSRGSVETRELLLVRLEDGDGFVGLGEAAPLPSYDGVTIADVRAALEDCRAVIRSGERMLREELLAACAGRAVLPHAIAAIDLALWDLEGRRMGEPVWQLLGAGSGEPVAVNATIAVADRAGAAAVAGAARERGFRCLKVKVGVGDDAGRVAAVRAAAGGAVAIRLDANGAWDVDEALAVLRALESAGIELCEEPVSGLDAIADVSDQTLVPIALDESSVLPGALDDRVCEAVCLKITRCGGISGVLQAATRAREAGYSVYLASTLDGPLGIAASLHAAAVVRPDWPCGLATLSMFDGRDDPLPVFQGRMPLPAGAGLGEGLAGWYLSQPR
jgi:L-Ala-D/L-Glu epimerase